VDPDDIRSFDGRRNAEMSALLSSSFSLSSLPGFFRGVITPWQAW
jgi:hypothetical protein